jgi:hypothetical protein
MFDVRIFFVGAMLNIECWHPPARLRSVAAARRLQRGVPDSWTSNLQKYATDEIKTTPAGFEQKETKVTKNPLSSFPLFQSSVFSSSVFFTRQKTASLQDTRRKTREPSASLGKREQSRTYPTSNS